MSPAFAWYQILAIKTKKNPPKPKKNQLPTNQKTLNNKNPQTYRPPPQKNPNLNCCSSLLTAKREK